MRRTLKLTAVVCLVALACAAVADAATRHIVRGRGWGHGIGMSQYGAFGYAEHGRSYRRILRHYYRGTRLRKTRFPRVRVLLQPADPYIRVRGASRVSGGRIKRLRPRTTYVVRRSGGWLSVRTSRGTRVGRFRSPVRFSRPRRALRLLGPALNGVWSGLYRGGIVVHRDGWGVTAVNSLSIDPYVQGVVPGEMPSSWHMEALKAQAVAARSYARATRKVGGVFDQYPDTRSQVYRGVEGETRRTNAAVRATARQILTYAGRPATTFFFSTSGGHTENVENVFLGSEPQPYLKGVRDPYDTLSPYHRWRRRFTTWQLTRRLRGYVRGSFRRITVLRRGASPRIVRARVYGTRGSRRISGPTLRYRLGLRDTWARFYRVSTSQARTAGSSGLARWSAWTPQRELTGSFEPAPSGRRLNVERRVGRRWRSVGDARTTRAGRYRVEVAGAGVYRVRAGSITGPAVRVR